MVAGFGRKGHAKGDIPGVRFKIVSVKGFSLKALYIEKAEKNEILNQIYNQNI